MQVNRKGRMIRRTFYSLAGIVFIILFLTILFKLMVKIDPPHLSETETGKFTRIQVDTNAYITGSNWLRKNKSGLWEIYISGDPYELGLKNGILNQELISKQEKAFIDFIKELIPSHRYLKFLRYAIAWFNKNLNTYIPLENLQEIYGISQSADPEFKFIGNNYERILNYHAAHDIGHAMQNLNLVACTSFGVWDEFSSDSSVLIGRNFDFYAGDEFAINKIVAFYHPASGFDFAMITWGGMTGVVSGMNTKGLTITLNAAKSEIPFGARTPVSIVARKILQYASNIDEAYTIAAGMETFVCETFLIGSAIDGYAAIIEKTTDTTVLFTSQSHYIIATNHLQHQVFENHKLNRENKENETSVYRFNRVNELIHSTGKFDHQRIAELLRDQQGSGDRNIGMGNEKAINQLIAHHSVIFKPDDLLMWVSASPYQLGEYVCYDLKKIFDPASEPDIFSMISVDSLMILPDTFLFSEQYQNFTAFKSIAADLISGMVTSHLVDPEKFIALNPEYFYTYELAGDYLSANVDASAVFYNFALTKEVSSATERLNLINKIKKAKR